MAQYLVTAQFVIEAESESDAENIVQNAVEGTAQHVETEDVTAEEDE